MLNLINQKWGLEIKNHIRKKGFIERILKLVAIKQTVKIF